jgi:hypothetical protein
MIAKKGWFMRRKYTGWGATPATWQGWVYTGALVLPFVLLAAFGASAEMQMTVTTLWIAVLIAAFVDIMQSIEKDERETLHEALAERNALWAMLGILTAGVAYQAAMGAVRQTWEIDPVILIALAAGLIVKAVTNAYYDKKD